MNGKNKTNDYIDVEEDPTAIDPGFWMPVEESPHFKLDPGFAGPQINSDVGIENKIEPAYLEPDRGRMKIFDHRKGFLFNLETTEPSTDAS